jgi:hypothetical protein
MLTPATLRIDNKGRACGQGHIAQGKKCRKAGGGPRNYAAEMAEQRQIMQSNDFNSWRKANKLRKPTTQGAVDRQFKQYSGSQQGAAINAAWKRHSQLKQERNRRNAGYALLGGAALGLTANVLLARRSRGFGRGDAAAHPLYGTTYIDPARPRMDAEGDGKKYSKTVTNPETGRKNKVRYGAKGYKIAPGTNKGDRYCARSFGDMKSHNKNCAGKDRNTPLCLSRAKWKCSGKSSRRDDGLTPGKS